MASYTVKDLRGKYCDPNGTWGTRPKGLGVVDHYNGPDVPAWAWKQPIKWIRMIINLHSQPGRFAAGWTFGGSAYHEFIFGRTVYRVMNWIADTPHCGNLQWNRNALGLHIPIGLNQRPRQVADGTMMTAMQRTDDHLRAMGVGRNRSKGHREVGASACPGEAIMASIRNYRAGAQLYADSPSKPTAKPEPEKTRIIHRVQIGWFEEYGNADGYEEKIRDMGIKCFKAEKNGGWAIYSGSYSSAEGATKRARWLQRQGIGTYVDSGSSGKA